MVQEIANNFKSTSRFEAYDHSKIINGFGHLYAMFRMILDHHGGNDFRSPHDHVRERRPLNMVGKTAEGINALTDEVNDYFGDHLPALLHV